MDAVLPRSVMVVDLRLLNAEDRCKLLRGELPDPLARKERLVPGLEMAGGRMVDEDVDDAHREGDARRNWWSEMRFSSNTASEGGSSSGR